ncbi:hypothetical protein BDZ97DRAFT_1918680 [Flammula alnicola]|nr:hypothetical protein BDZ97DRAFT_1918680 [Flammula alnicola]
MREAGRPLDLALYGWGRDFVEIENTYGLESARRMSQVSHVSTIQATVMNIAGATHMMPIQPTDEEDDAESTVEEDALFEGLGSVMEDSEEESETEWLAWPTDLSRQAIVHQQKMELDQIQRQRAREDELRDQLDHDQPPLSPMGVLESIPWHRHSVFHLSERQLTLGVAASPATENARRGTQTVRGAKEEVGT